MKTESLFLKRCFWMLFSILGIMLGVSCSDSDDEMGDEGDTQESSEKGSEIIQKGSEKKFGDSKNKSKSIGKTAQKIIDFVISDPSM